MQVQKTEFVNHSRLRDCVCSTRTCTVQEGSEGQTFNRLFFLRPAQARSSQTSMSSIFDACYAQQASKGCAALLPGVQ